MSFATLSTGFYRSTAPLGIVYPIVFAGCLHLCPRYLDLLPKVVQLLFLLKILPPQRLIPAVVFGNMQNDRGHALFFLRLEQKKKHT